MFHQGEFLKDISIWFTGDSVAEWRLLVIEDDKAGGDNHTDDREEISEGTVTDIDYRL